MLRNKYMLVFDFWVELVKPSRSFMVLYLVLAAAFFGGRAWGKAPGTMESGISPVITGNVVDELASAGKKKGKNFLLADSLRLESLTDDQFLERMQYDYTKLCLKTKDSIVTVEIDGYIINLLPVAVKNGWIDRNLAATEVLEYLTEFYNAKVIHGFFPRSFNRKSGKIAAVDYWTFGRPYDVYGTAVIEASLKFIIAKFFDRNNPSEIKIRSLCQKIVERINWNFAYDESKKCFTWFKNGPNGELFDGKDLIGIWDETFFIQLLALGDKKWKYGLQAYDNFVSKLKVDSMYGYRLYPTPQIGYAAQTFLWFDLRNYTDPTSIRNNLGYFESVRNSVLMQMKYARLNPKKHPYYGDIWGIGEIHNDSGDIFLEEVFSSIIFEPRSAIKCLRNIYRDFKNKGVYSKGGLHGKINVVTGEIQSLSDKYNTPWFGFYLPLNVLYMENYRSGLIWKLAKSTPEYPLIFSRAGLQKVTKKRSPLR